MIRKKLGKRKRGRPKGMGYVRYPKEAYPIYLNLTCTQCHKNIQLHINKEHLPLYTDELKRNYVCLLCKSGRGNWRERLEAKGLLPKREKKVTPQITKKRRGRPPKVR